MTTHVLYHSGCADGFTAAWAVWRHLGDHARYIPVKYGAPPPVLPAADNVVLVDFSYDRPTIEALRERHAALAVLDHHKSAQAALEGLPYCVFDMNKSGAMLAWEHFHSAAPPALVAYVQDRDLWRWALPDSREIAAALWSYPMHFDVWDVVAAQLESPVRRGRFVEEGAAILRYMDQQTKMICKQAHWEGVGGFVVPVVNATTLFSEVGEELLAQYLNAPFVASYFDRADGIRQWSLRSRGDFDVSRVATRLGGGGHAAAAGFQVAAPKVI